MNDIPLNQPILASKSIVGGTQYARLPSDQ